MAHLVAGMILVALGACGIWAWWPSFGLVMRGVLPFTLVAVGLLALASSYKRLAPNLEDTEPEE